MRIGFISTRLAGTDGVSLETAKLATICRRLGHDVFYCAGELDADGPPGLLAPRMHFVDPEARWIHDHCFGVTSAIPGLFERIELASRAIESSLAEFVARFRIDTLFVQNALAIPMQVPLGVALTRFIERSGISTIAHHHDLYWERERFLTNCIPIRLEAAFPPRLPSVRHIVINSLARQELNRRRGLDSTVLPNIFDFATPPPEALPDSSLRRELGLTEDQLLILQPTRVIPRKGIELAIELVRRLRLPESLGRLGSRDAVLVISHAAGDEGLDYLRTLQAAADRDRVPLIYAGDRFAASASDHEGRRTRSLWDAYLEADFVTYPSLIEGFGNALLETAYFRRPALVNRYPVYAADIAPCGFDFVEVDGMIDDAAVDRCVSLLADAELRRRSVDHNFAVATAHFSYEAVTPVLKMLLES